jgi:two-component system CheB/CheR fusion protein
VICRNVLIYFDSPSQRQILARIHYALEPGGVLFLGKAESKLSESHLFRPVELRWRLFERLDGAGSSRSTSAQEQHRSMRNAEKLPQELNRMELYQRALLNAVHSGLMLLDANDVLLTHNEAVMGIWALPKGPLNGKRLQDTEISARCPELVQRVEESRAHPQPVTFQYNARFNGEDKVIQVDIQPVVSPEGERTGTIVHCDDITPESTLQSTVEQLEATGEELQSANEELETTNEELQSTNEELETTNEELQSTNEELETTNEELQSLNEELENMNDELESRTRELNDLTSRYAETLQRMPWPVMLVDRSEKVQLWNAAAQRLLGVSAASVAGAEISRLPIDKALTDVLVRRCRAALAGKKESVVTGQKFRLGSTSQAFDLHFTRIMSQPGSEGVLVMFAASGLPGGTSEKATAGKGVKIKAQAKRGSSRKKASGDPRSRKRG